MNKETLLVSNPGVTTYYVIDSILSLEFSYELRYYQQVEMIELVKIKNIEQHEFIVRPLLVTTNPIKILEVLKKDKISNETYFEWEKTILQFLDGDTECLKRNA